MHYEFKLCRPEFFGVTELSVSAEDLAKRRRLASDEQLYSAGTFTQRVDIDALGREIANSAELLTAPSLPVRIREDGSCRCSSRSARRHCGG